MALPKNGPPPAPINPLFERWNLASHAAEGATGSRLRRLAQLAIEPALRQVRVGLGALRSSVDVAHASLGDVESRLDALASRLEGERTGEPLAQTSAPRRRPITPLVTDVARGVEQITLTLGLVEQFVARGADEPTDVLEALALAAALVVASTQPAGGVRWSPPSTAIVARAPRVLVVATIAVALRGMAELTPPGVDADVRIELDTIEGAVAVLIHANVSTKGATELVAETLRELLEPWSGVGVAARPAELVITWLEADINGPTRSA